MGVMLWGSPTPRSPGQLSSHTERPTHFPFRAPSGSHIRLSHGLRRRTEHTQEMRKCRNERVYIVSALMLPKVYF